MGPGERFAASRRVPRASTTTAIPRGNRPVVPATSSGRLDVTRHCFQGNPSGSVASTTGTAGTEPYDLRAPRQKFPYDSVYRNPWATKCEVQHDPRHPPRFLGVWGIVPRAVPFSQFERL